METKNRDRFEKLKSLTPIQAVEAWLNGEFGIGDEPAMIAAIRKDQRIQLSDQMIIQLIGDAMADEIEPTDCLERLASA